MSALPPFPGPEPGWPSRRDVLHVGGALLTAVTLAGCGATGAAAADVQPGAAQPQPQPPAGHRPRARLVASTWSFGQAANAEAWRVLQGGGQPLDACEAGVKVTEADPAVTSVGYGGLPNAEGVVELDASVMRGDSLQCGAVASLRGFLHPVSAARAVMERTRHVLLVGQGAAEFARAQGLHEQDLLTPESRRRWEAWCAEQATGAAEPWEQARVALAGRDHDHDTIGMIVADRGRLATAVTTSGLAWKLPGRVGDSPIIGAGSYCDDEAGAAVSTGVGEEVIRVGGCVTIVEALRRGLTPRRAGIEVLRRVRRSMARAGRSGDVAFIVCSREGATWGGCLNAGFQYALTDDDGTRLVNGEVVS